MKLAIIIHAGIGSGYKSQGIPSIVNFAEKMALQHEVTVYSFSATDVGFQPQGYRMKCFPFKYKRFNYVTFCKFFFCFLCDHIKNKYNVVHGLWALPGGFVAVLLGKLLRIKSVVSFLGVENVYIPEIDYGLAIKQNKRIQWVCNNAHYTVVMTQYQKDSLLKSFKLKKEVKVISWGADKAQFSPLQKHDSQILHIINIAHLNKVKNHKMLLEVVKKLSEQIPLTLTVIGRDTLSGQIQKLANDYRLLDRIDFMGDVEHSALPNYFQQADIMLHTSYYEAQAIVVNEALATGTVVCGTRVGIIDDLENDCVLAVDVNDVNAMVDAVLRVWNNKQLLKEYQLKGLNYSASNDFETTIKSYTDVYNP